ncbi:hypothetical protein OESDEN_09891 [Oesophagostomum dentatum]|uniref:Uncharacterized protein n=1 Tax=Oesophagostomum dentatum TaxID=61180 RepID=A0A0B1SYA0_OESDE|nr:hypothetical protein OESDEN_09891 [Oesophagostomum dentatum]
MSLGLGIFIVLPTRMIKPTALFFNSRFECHAHFGGPTRKRYIPYCHRATRLQLLVTALGLRTTCAIFGGMSLVSMASKAFFLRALYVRKPKLAVKQRQEETSESEIEGLLYIVHIYREKRF